MASARRTKCSVCFTGLANTTEMLTSPATVDADMCAEAISTKMDLVKHIGIILHGEVKPSESLKMLCS